MGIPLATESSGVGVRKRGAEESTEMKEEEPARQRSRLENVGNREPEFDIFEVFSRARVVKTAVASGLRGGYSLDIVVKDLLTGRAWDLRCPGDQRRLWSLLHQRPAGLLVASPPCTTFSSLQNFRKLDEDREHVHYGTPCWRKLMDDRRGEEPDLCEGCHVSGPGSVHVRTCERRGGRSSASQKGHKLVRSRTSVEYEMQPCTPTCTAGGWESEEGSGVSG